MSKEHSEWLASLPPAEREALNKGLSALETMADLWAVEINLGKMSETIAGAADPAKRAFAIKSMVEQGFIEGAYRTYLDFKDGKLPGQSARPEAAHKWIRAYALLTKSLDLSDLADYDDELASEVKKLSKEAQEILDAPFLCAPSPLARRGEET